MDDGAILSAWNLVGEASPTTSPRVTKLQTPSGCFYLKASASAQSVERDLDLLKYLTSAGLPVPRYMRTAAGRRFALIEGKAFWISRELPGHHFAQFHGPKGLGQVESLATRLGELHRILIGPPNPQRFPVFRDSAEDLLATLVASTTPFDAGRLQRLRGEVASVAPLPKQLIHRDFHRGNVLFAGEAVSGFFDFDLVHQGPRLFDVCYCATKRHCGNCELSEQADPHSYRSAWIGLARATRAA